MREMNRAAALPSVLLCLALAYAAGLVPTGAEDTAVLTGTVADAAGRPLAGAEVTISGDGVGRSSARTPESGVYRFPGLRPFHRYRIAVEEPGYRSIEYDGMRLEPGRTRVIDFRMNRPGDRDVVVLATRDPFPYDDLVRAFRQHLDVPVRVVDLDAEPDPAERVRQVAAERPSLILGAGLKAARLIRRDVSVAPVILTLIDDSRRYDLQSANLCFLANNPDPDSLLRRVIAVLPQARSIGLLYDADASALLARDLRDAAGRRGLHVELRPAYSQRELAGDLARLRDPIDALLVPYDPLTATPRARDRITAWARGHRVPVIAPAPEWVRQGALLSYGAPAERLGEEAARIAEQILFHARQPADFSLRLPENPLVAVNRETAAELGVTIPPSLGVDETF